MSCVRTTAMAGAAGSHTVLCTASGTHLDLGADHGEAVGGVRELRDGAQPRRVAQRARQVPPELRLVVLRRLRHLQLGVKRLQGERVANHACVEY